MQVNSKPFKQIDREYIITSAELRKALKLEGEIISMGLQRGRSPNDIEEGKSPEKDLWYINTKDVLVVRSTKITNFKKSKDFCEYYDN